MLYHGLGALTFQFKTQSAIKKMETKKNKGLDESQKTKREKGLDESQKASEVSLMFYI